MRFSTEWTIPEAERWEVVPLHLNGTEYLALTEIAQSANGGSWDDPANRILGHPNNFNGPTLLQCDVAARDLRAVRWDRVTAEEERAAAARWRLLLQLEGDRDVPYNWGSGVLHFCIERTALARRDFRRTRVNMQLL